MAILGALHVQVSRTYNPQSGVCKDHSTIAMMISANGISYAVAHSIAQQFLSLHSSASSNITDLRVSRIQPLTRDDCFWVVLVWRENVYIDVLAIFHIDNENNPGPAYNWLMHHGYEGNSNKASDRNWISTSISWSVTSFGNLKLLFGAARHILGILELPDTDALTLYCGPEEGNGSEEKYHS